MLRTILIATFATLSSASAFAHPGHIADVGQGHSHFTTISAFVIIAIAATIAFKKRTSS